jgi:hypothetical protein
MRKFYFLLLSLFLFSLAAKAQNGPPAYISYEWLDSNRVKVRLHIYRDCRGLSWWTTTTFLAIGKSDLSGVRDLKVGRESIKSVSRFCKRNQDPCNPVNSDYAGEGYEEHVFSATVNLKSDFGGAYNNEDYIMIYYTNCCRDANLVNIDREPRRAIYTKIRRDAWHNNSIDINNLKPEKIYVNEAYYGGLEVLKTDGDSLSIKPTSAIEAASGTKSKFSFGYSEETPIKVHDPTGRGLVAPTTLPPTGYYVNSVSGEVIFTPTKTGSYLLPFLIQEWETIDGISTLISESQVDKYIIVRNSGNNHLPELSRKLETFYVCAGDSFVFNAQVNDKDIEIPGGGKITDSVSVRYSFEGQGEVFIVDSTYQPKIEFGWQTSSTDSREQPYLLHIYLEDDNCPVGFSTFTQKIFVKPAFEVDHSIKDLTCNSYEIKGQVAEGKRGKREIRIRRLGDPNFDPIEDYSVKYDASANATLLDTLTFLTKNTYVVHTTHESEFGCSKTFVDTITTSEPLSPLFTKDTFLFCKGTSLTVQSDVVRLDTFASLSFDTIRVWDQGGYERLYCEAYPQNGCPSADYVHIFNGEEPILKSATEDDTLCLPFTKDLVLNTEHQAGYRDSFLWDDGTQLARYAVNKAETYAYEIKNHCGSTKGSIRIDTFPNHVSVQITGNEVLCNGKQTLIAGPLIDSLVWEDGSTSTDRIVNEVETYYVYSKSTCGESSDSFKITGSQLIPTPDLGGSKDFCKEIYHELIHSPREGETLLWSNSKSDTILKARNPGWYWVEVSNRCGTVRDSFEVILYDDPVRVLPEDTSFCVGETMTLDAGNEGAEYEWNTGETTKAISLDKAGTYVVKVENFCSHPEFTVEVQNDSLLQPNLGQDTMLDKPFKLTLDPGVTGRTYVWSTGEVTETIEVKDWGEYSVAVTNACGTFADSITVSGTVGIINFGKNSWKVYPNPSSDLIYIEGIQKGDRLIVANSLGKSLFEQKATSQSMSLTLPESAGVYTIQWMRNGNLLETQKVLKLE